MQNLHKLFNPNATPQSRAIDNAQIRNSAGGFVWELDPWKRLERFVILGSEGGSYYASAQTFTVENAENVVRLLKEDGVRVVARVLELSTAGRAYKNDAALFVLALAFSVGDADTKAAAKLALPKVARTGTHLFTFMTYVDSMRGWGRGLRGAVANWYGSKDLDKLAYQVTKYAQRNGWTHRDALRLAHPKTEDAQRDALYRYITGHKDKIEDSGLKIEDSETSLDWLEYIRAVEAVKVETNVQAVVEAITRYNLPREVLPTEMLREAAVWEALLQRMPMTAMIRNLATMTRVGLLTPMSEAVDMVVARVTDAHELRKARVHPIQILAALMTYSAGRGARGKATWEPVQKVVDALDRAFYLTFENVQPTGKRVLMGLDVSGSMTWGELGGVPGLSPRVASAALALVTAATEPQHALMAFANTFVPLNISPRQRLDDVVKRMDGMPFGGTDCALPMQYALKEKLEVDAFVVLTDSETWFGQQHPAQALQEYRTRMGIPAKLVVVGMLGNRFTIADPNDALMLDVVGFSANTPTVIADFIRD